MFKVNTLMVHGGRFSETKIQYINCTVWYYALFSLGLDLELATLL